MMSRQTLSRNDRVAQMTKQEELIAKKRLEILEKQKTLELGKAVAAAQSGNQNSSKQKEPTTSEPPSAAVAKPPTAISIVPPEIQAKFQNSFCNDGSFLTHFKNILEQTKKKEEPPVLPVEESLQVIENATNDESAIEIQTNQPLSIAQIDLSKPPPQHNIPQQQLQDDKPASSSPSATETPTDKVTEPSSSLDAADSSAEPSSSIVVPASQCSSSGSPPAPSGSTVDVAVVSPENAADSAQAAETPPSLTGSLAFLNGPPPLASGPPMSHTAPLPSMSGPPPSMSGPRPSISGPPPNMSGPPPGMSAPPLNMSGPPPLVSGPPPNAGANLHMTGPPPPISRITGTTTSMPGPPPLTSMPPPRMAGQQLSSMGPGPGFSNRPPFNTPPTQRFFNPCIPSPLAAFTSIITPPPPPPPSTPLYLIPPPDPLQLNKIPPPRDLDLNAIPKPEMNLERIQVPNEYELQHQQQQQQQQQAQHMPLHQQGHRELQQDANEQFLPTTLESLIELVAENGDACEDRIRSRKNDVHSSLWFIFDTESLAYRKYRSMVESYRLNRNRGADLIVNSNFSDDSNSRKLASNDEKYDPESVIESHDDSDDEYMRDIMDKNLSNLKRKIEESKVDSDGSGDEQRREKNRKRKSRWGGRASMPEPMMTTMAQTCFGNQNKPMLSAIQRTDPALLQYARQNYGTTNLTEEDWIKCEDHFKINLLYQDMMKKRNEIDQLARNGKFKYEYDSDEDITGGTWEHKLRTAEMEATQAWADALTAQSEGKHHIGDFLPPEELKKFMEKYDAKKSNRTPDLSDYKEYKLREDNIGFQMLQKLGWKEGQGLGADGSGIVDPVNKAAQRDANQGLGAGTPSNPDDCDNEYEAYRKRMMLAYRFRPNPLNNPRRAYY